MPDTKQVMPNFIGIGAQRCATSWLYFCLREHPQIYLPFIKEVAFFNRFYDKGLDWYLKYFESVQDHKAVGEITPSYLYVEGTAEKIARHLPEARLIVSLRNPIERAYSQYRKHRRAGEKEVDFETALEQNKAMIDRGRYYPQLMRYTRLFPKERMLIFLYEDIQEDSRAVLKKIFAFLGVDENFVPRSADQIVPSENLVSGLHVPVSNLASQFRKMGMGGIVDLAKKSPIGSGVNWMRHRFGPKVSKTGRFEEASSETAIKPETRQRLRETFREDNRKLADFLGRDLSFWA